MRQYVSCCAVAVCLTAGTAVAQGQGVSTNREPEAVPPTIADEASVLDRRTGAGCQLAPPDGRSELRYRGLIFQGNTVFSTAEILAQLDLQDGVAQRAFSIDDVACIRVAVTQFYIANGYINSGVLAEVPSVLGEPVVFKVVEGVLSDVRIQSVKTPDGDPGGLQPSYPRDRLLLDSEQPLSRDVLEGRFQALLQDPNIERLNGRLVPGETLGEAVLDVDVVQTEPLSFVVGANNFDPSNTGEFVGFAGATLRNQIGFGDALAVEFEGSRGRRSVSADLEAPISAEGLLLVAGVDYVTTEVIEEPLDVLEIEADFLRLSAGLTWKFYDVGTERLTFGLRFDYQQSETFLLGEPFSFASGAQAGVTQASILRVFAEYVRRTQTQAYSVRGTTSVGLPVLDPTRNGGSTPDAAFVTFLGEAFYIRSIYIPFVDRNLELALRGISQISSDRLLPFEQVALTGADAVRGFREDAVADDNLALLDVSARTQVFSLALPFEASDAAPRMSVFAKPFVTAGTAWPKGDIRARATAVGTGLTLDLSPRPGLVFSLGFGTPIYASDAIESLDADETRIYFGSEFRF